MSIISLDNIALIINDLNREMIYKISENRSEFNEELLFLVSSGDDHSINIFGAEIWSSKSEKELENIPIEIEIELNERKQFEKHIRVLIMDKINILKNLEL